MNNFLKNSPRFKKRSYSIVTPTFAIKASYLERFFDSLLLQTEQSFEICFCNDGDTDPDVLKCIRKYEVKFGSRFRYIFHEKNQGICAGTRSALSLATGDYIAFVDADDELHPKCFELLTHFIGEAEDYDFIYTNHDKMTDWDLRYEPITKPIWSPETLLNVNYVNHLAILKRTLLPELGSLFEKRYEGAQDWDLCTRVIERAKRVGHLPFFLYHWRMRPGSVAISPRSKPYTVEARYRALSDYFLRQNTPIELTADYQLNFKDPVYRLRIETVELIPQQIVGASFSDLQKFLPSDDSLFLMFLVRGYPAIVGDFEALCCYSSLRGVGPVFPFHIDGRRASYTLKNKWLEPVKQSKSNFSINTGNVLAGPTHGCVIKASKLKLLLNEALETLGDYRFRTIEELGPMLSLLGLRKSLRSVCVNKAKTEQTLTAVQIPEILIPKIDPYL